MMDAGVGGFVGAGVGSVALDGDGVTPDSVGAGVVPFVGVCVGRCVGACVVGDGVGNGPTQQPSAGHSSNFDSPSRLGHV